MSGSPNYADAVDWVKSAEMKERELLQMKKAKGRGNWNRSG